MNATDPPTVAFRAVHPASRPPRPERRYSPARVALAAVLAALLVGTVGSIAAALTADPPPAPAPSACATEYSGSAYRFACHWPDRATWHGPWTGTR